MDSVNLTNHFLIAMPGMADPYFSKTLTLICEHSDKGAIGLVINKPIDVSLGNLFEQVNIDLQDEALRMETVYFGGPVLVDRGFVLHQPLSDWHSTLKINDDTGLTFVSRQPATEDELVLAEEALNACATASIGNDGV